jgi:class 3 adenylate cyclase
MNSKGAPRYTTKRWLDVSNTGSADAENVTFEAIHDGYMILFGSKEPTTIHKGQSRRLPVQYAAAGSDGARLRIRWTEGGEDKDCDFHVG